MLAPREEYSDDPGGQDRTAPILADTRIGRVFKGSVR